jgi:hypothetical protein
LIVNLLKYRIKIRWNRGDSCLNLKIQLKPVGFCPSCEADFSAVLFYCQTQLVSVISILIYFNNLRDEGDSFFGGIKIINLRDLLVIFQLSG